MSVMVETSLGSFVIDLFIKDCPLACENFLKLCKLKYYNGHLFFNVINDFMLQSGDPTGTGKGGASYFKKPFKDEIMLHRTFHKKGLVASSNMDNKNNSQFFITTGDQEACCFLNGKHTIFGEIEEGMEIVEEMNVAYVDGNGRPFTDLRILHTYVLDDPFPDADDMQIPPNSPVGKPKEESVPERLALHESLHEENGRTEEEIEKSVARKEAQSRAVVLEMVGDIPDADIKPPDEILFVAQVNPITTSADLELIFSRFGPCKAEIITDFKTGDSLSFGFVEFTKKEHCEEAYFKMNNVLIDDRRIKVDFSQSVSKLWNTHGRKKKSRQHGDKEGRHVQNSGRDHARSSRHDDNKSRRSDHHRGNGKEGGGRHADHHRRRDHEGGRDSRASSRDDDRDHSRSSRRRDDDHKNADHRRHTSSSSARSTAGYDEHDTRRDRHRHGSSRSRHDDEDVRRDHQKRRRNH